jgi:excisionase family DNA binding protein
VREAAEQLGVAPRRVRALIQDGRLPARRLGRSWAIDSSEDSWDGGSRRPGRPLRSANAWALLAILHGSSPDWVAPAVRSRLKKRASDRAWVEAALRHGEPRADVLRWRVLAPDLERIPLEFPLIPGGLSANDPGIDVLPIGAEVDAYVSPRIVSSIRSRFRPLESADASNLILRVPSDEWVLQQERAPSSVVAADLLDHPDPRVSRAARRLLRDLAR